MTVLSMYGYAKTEIVGKNISVLVPEPMATVHQQFMVNFVETGREVLAALVHVVFTFGSRNDYGCFGGSLMHCVHVCRCVLVY